MTPAAPAPGEGVPRPEGWIGTVDQWTQGLGIALVLLNLIVLVLAWRRLRRSHAVRPALGLLFIGLAVLPVIAIFLGYSKGMAGMQTVGACGGCHVMTAYVEDLRNPESEALAVVDCAAERRVIGMLTESHTLKRYSDELERQRRTIAGEPV